MSTEEGENVRVKDGQKIRVEIDRTEEMKELQEQNNELKTTLQLLAEKEFQAKCKQHGLDPQKASVEDLEQILKSETKRAPRGNPEDTLSWNQAIGSEKEDVRAKTDLASILTDNTESGLKSAIEFLNFKKKNGTLEEKAEARKLLAVCEKKIFSKGKTLLDMEFSGNLKDLAKREITIKDDWTDEQKRQAEEKNAEIRKKRSAWTQKT
jgi:hypothetical protein